MNELEKLMGPKGLMHMRPWRRLHLETLYLVMTACRPDLERPKVRGWLAGSHALAAASHMLTSAPCTRSRMAMQLLARDARAAWAKQLTAASTAGHRPV